MTTVFASTPAEWRAWLAKHSQSQTEVWLVIYHKNSGTPSVRYNEAIEQALCYGWIDGLHRKRDAESSRLRFTPRNPRSTWSAVNRRRAAKMIEKGLMTEPGQAVIDTAMAKGTWAVVPDVASVPDDLKEELNRNDAARRNFQAFPPSSKRLILEWIITAKQPDTRRRRIAQTVDLAAVNVRANHPGR